MGGPDGGIPNNKDGKEKAGCAQSVCNNLPPESNKQILMRKTAPLRLNRHDLCRSGRFVTRRKNCIYLPLTLTLACAGEMLTRISDTDLQPGNTQKRRKMDLFHYFFFKYYLLLVITSYKLCSMSAESFYTSLGTVVNLLISLNNIGATHLAATE